MVTPPRDRVLLALLLAFRKMTQPLNQSDELILFPQLFEVGEQLQLDPDYWDFIYEGLIAHIINYNVLNQVYQQIYTQIATVDAQILQDISPTTEEVLQVDNVPIYIEMRGDDHNQLNSNNPHFLQIAVTVLKSNNPYIAAQKSDWLNRVTKTLQHLEPSVSL
ncbi:hypothetical protein [Nodularia sphaerocarpa]|uniref:hypothetical protein n=1 Tax=Nodularia sphaerocarpa TaxID=137816 RepID=UPI001EFAF178|nr:hypothetical protein [Nodularia sphaerocarpa]MDB9375789.1 hypothetical protein [Nodularia sphaerocarpa CS-585]MDB9378124.1 hypothetical protein [Nodularia sphaerocarpa CS-585A2]ULP71894.1 hypothetical protein BDGGKGIB_01531 [Nodularia sphaerocarpa UHCC 0038]